MFDRLSAVAEARRRFTRRRSRVGIASAIVVLAALPLLASCAASPDPNDGATAGPDGGTVIEMTDDLRFDPEELTIRVGETVTWRNTSSIDHTATDDPGKAEDPANAVLPEGAEPWDSGNMEPGAEWSYTFEVAGEYTYFCIPHETAGMVGRLNVVEP